LFFFDTCINTRVETKSFFHVFGPFFEEVALTKPWDTFNSYPRLYQTQGDWKLKPCAVFEKFQKLTGGSNAKIELKQSDVGEILTKIRSGT